MDNVEQRWTGLNIRCRVADTLCNHRLRVEPTTGIEPVTYGLRNRRTSTNPSTGRQIDRAAPVETTADAPDLHSYGTPAFQ